MGFLGLRRDVAVERISPFVLQSLAIDSRVSFAPSRYTCAGAPMNDSFWASQGIFCNPRTLSVASCFILSNRSL
jgi:hypothetical protein